MRVCTNCFRHLGCDVGCDFGGTALDCMLYNVCAAASVTTVAVAGVGTVNYALSRARRD